MAAGASSPDALCSRCADIDFKGSSTRLWNSKIPHQSAVNLGRYFETVKNPECPCCVLLFRLVARHVHPVEREARPSTLPDILDQNFYLRPFAFKRSDEGGDLVIAEESPSFNVVEDWILRAHPQFHIDESLALWANLGFLKPAPRSDSNLVHDSDQPEPLADLRLSRSWLEHCRREHASTCESISNHWILNFRVIDCRNLDVVKASHETKYVALSYVWGRTTGDDVTDALCTLPTHVPATLRDAIHITKKLGYSYLWVDRYCIPQHDGKERQDQISQMGLIYANADLTIVAAASNDSAHGIPGVGRVREKLESINTADTRYTLTPPNSRHQVQVSKWNSRGWTYQEGVFSRRRLVFLPQEVYFECSAVRLNDALHQPLTFEQLETSSDGARTPESEEEGVFLALKEGPYPMDEFFTHVSRYTARQLSFPGDILNGMLGIIDAFDHNYPLFVHLEGVPMVPDSTFVSWDGPIWIPTREEQLLTGMCWKSRLWSKRNRSLPSWSWTGWYGAVRPRSPYERFVHNAFEVRFLIKLADGDFVDLDSFASSYCIGFYENYRAQLLLIWATVIPVQLWHSETRRKPRLMGHTEWGMWNPIIEVGDVTIPCEAFHLTLDMSELAGSPTKWAGDKIRGLQGLVMGVRRGTYFAGYGVETRRTLSGNQDNHLVVMVVRELGEGLSERVSLLELPWDQEKTTYGQQLLAQAKTPRQKIRLA